MGVHKQSVSFTDAAFNFARELVESGEYPNISAAVSGEMARARAARELDRISQGHIAVDRTPGLGVQADHAAIAPFLFAECPAPRPGNR